MPRSEAVVEQQKGGLSRSCDNIDFLLVGGDDTLIIMENLRPLLADLWNRYGVKDRPMQPLYMGSFFENVKRQRLAANVTRKHHDRNTFTYASGAGYIVNRASLQALMRCEPKLVAEPVHSEDKMLGVCLEQRGLVNRTVSNLSVVQENISRGQIRGRPSAYSITRFPSAIRINSRISVMFDIKDKSYGRNVFLFHYVSGPKLFMLYESIKGFAAQRECVRKGFIRLPPGRRPRNMSGLGDRIRR